MVETPYIIKKTIEKILYLETNENIKINLLSLLNV